MKRALRSTFWIGAVAIALTIALQKFGLLHRPETLIDRWIFGEDLTDNPLTNGNYLLIVGLGFAVAWTFAEVLKFTRRVALLLLLLAELIGAAGVLALADIYFQPLPGVLVALFATILAVALGFTEAGRRRRNLVRLFSGRLAPAGISRLTDNAGRDHMAPRNHEITFVHCEIANQAQLMEQMTATAYAALMEKLTGLAREVFLREGGCLHAADGEGIRIVFGFPNSLGEHAGVACRAARAFRRRVGDSLGEIDLRTGISSGLVLATLPNESVNGPIVINGEPLEIARRLALANQFYGSEILLGPRAFAEAGAAIVARPLDFLRGAETHERLELYELLALATEASAEEIASRDYFWTGLVYFRERRWTEAFAEFNRARRPDSDKDQPLQWYLRQLEPIILHMATEPAAELPSPF